jgi:hypothetical protein
MAGRIQRALLRQTIHVFGHRSRQPLGPLNPQDHIDIPLSRNSAFKYIETLAEA